MDLGGDASRGAATEAVSPKCPFCSDTFEADHRDHDNGVGTGICWTCRELAEVDR